MHLFHIPHCSIQNRNVHISVLYGALWDITHLRYAVIWYDQREITPYVPIPLNYLCYCWRSALVLSDFMHMWQTCYHVDHVCFFRVCIFHACTGLWPLKRFNQNLNLNLNLGYRTGASWDLWIRSITTTSPRDEWVKFQIDSSIVSCRLFVCHIVEIWYYNKCEMGSGYQCKGMLYWVYPLHRCH